MRRTNLFTATEVRELEGHRGSRPVLVATWALDEVKAAILRGDAAAAADAAAPDGTLWLPTALSTTPQLLLYASFEAAARDFVTHTSALMEAASHPVPWPYLHLLRGVLLTLLLVVAYALVERLDAAAVLSLPCYAAALFILIGLEQASLPGPFVEMFSRHLEACL